MLVMFDLDNTLADRAAAFEAWASEFVTTHQLGSDDHRWLVEIDCDGYASRRQVFDTIVERFGLGDPDAFLAHYRRRVIELITLTPGATDCLRHLRTDGHSLAIVTNGSTVQQNAKLDRLGLRELVDAVLVSETVGVSKPYPQIFEMAAAATGSELGGAWMVGDSAVNDIAGAQPLGLRTAWITRGRTWDDRRQPPDVIADDLHDLADVIVSR